MYRDTDGEETLRLFYGAHPLLIVHAGSKDGDPALIATSVEGFRTRTYERVEKQETAKWNLGEAHPPTGGGNAVGEVIVVAKSDRNPFVGIITVGRAKNNDIILAAPSVSKLQAFIKQDDSEQSEQWTLEDKNSTNDTQLNAQRLEPNQATALTIGDEIVFGEVRCVFTNFQGLLDTCSRA
jgi:hypothetical protein